MRELKEQRISDLRSNLIEKLNQFELDKKIKDEDIDNLEKLALSVIKFDQLAINLGIKLPSRDETMISYLKTKDIDLKEIFSKAGIDPNNINWKDLFKVNTKAYKESGDYSSSDPNLEKLRTIVKLFKESQGKKEE